MLEYNQVVKKRVIFLTRVLAVVLPAICIVLLISQTVFAKNTYVINDGDTVLIHTTDSTDPETILSEAGLELGDADTYTTRTGLMISGITIQRTQTVVVRWGSTTLQMQTRGETLQALLERAGISPVTQAEVSLPLDSSTYDGLVITVYKSQTTTQSYTQEVPYETIYCYDPTLAEGEKKVLTAGVTGMLSVTADVTSVNGTEVDRSIISQTVLQPVVNEIVAVGERELKETDLLLPEVAAAIAQATETGKPVVLDGLLVTPEGEVVSYSRSKTFKATAYHNTDPGCTIWTSTGTLCRVGAIAVDPKVIPYGTEMYIISNDGTYVYGYAVAEDCGSAIKGNRIDLYYDTVAECIQFGRRDCTVYFLN